MERDREGLAREVADSSESSDDSSEQTYVVREGAARSIDAEEVELTRDATTGGDSTATRQDAHLGPSSIDPTLERPPNLRESVELGDAPDGSSIGGGLTSPTGDAIGGGGLATSIQGRASSFGGDALGRGLNFDPAAGSSDRDLGRALGSHDGSLISAAPRDPVTGMPTGADPGTPEYEFIHGKPMPTNRAEDPNWDGPVDKVYPTNRFEDPNYDGSDDHAPPMTGRDQDPTDEEQGDDIVGPGYAQPDPNAGDDVVTGEALAAAVRINDPGVYAQPTQDGDDSAGTAAAVARASVVNDPQQVTNYGPEGPQTVDVGDNWAPPVDTLFDPPPESGSAGMLGGESAMADPAAAFGGASVIGSSTPEEAPPPPDPPPGEDPDQGPLGPPGGGGGEG